MIPGLHFVEVAHEQGCPGRYENGRGCDCCPTVSLHGDLSRFMRGEAENRAARRKAAREADKALRRARGKAR